MGNRTPAQTKRLARLRLDAAKRAKDDLLDFTKFIMPDPQDVEDPRKSRYEVARVHEAIAEACEDCEKNPAQRLIINCPPRHGKTQLASLSFVPWFIGRNPLKSTIFGTYNEVYARKVGKEIRDTMLSPQYQQVFPDVELKTGSKAANRFELKGGGGLSFAGRGGTITGLGGHGIILDDPIKDAEEARSELIRDNMWEWYNRVIATRLMDDTAFILVIQTRWHEDDLVGRLTDPENPHYLKAEARKWKIIDLPALAEDKDMLGRAPGEALWPQRFSEKYLNERRRADPEGFSALFQGRPSVKEGQHFTTSMIHEYDPAHDLPDREHLEIYCAADLAVATNQNNDRTCLISVGVDKHDNIYVLPDLVWTRIPADQIVEQMCRLMKTHNPVAFFSENGQITNTLGPFLRKRMAELDLHCHVSEIAPKGDKLSRAQAIMGRMSMGKVFFPRSAPWFQRAKTEMLKFPKSNRDDFVDALAYIGMALNQLRTGTKPDPRMIARKGSFAEMFINSNQGADQDARSHELSEWGRRDLYDVSRLN